MALVLFCIPERELCEQCYAVNILCPDTDMAHYVFDSVLRPTVSHHLVNIFVKNVLGRYNFFSIFLTPGKERVYCHLFPLLC